MVTGQAIAGVSDVDLLTIGLSSSDAVQIGAELSLLAVAGLASVHDHTWTADRETSAARWSEIVPEHRAGLAQLMSWTLIPPDPPVDTVRDVLDGTVEAIVSAFSGLIGVWPYIDS